MLAGAAAQRGDLPPDAGSDSLTGSDRPRDRLARTIGVRGPHDQHARTKPLPTATHLRTSEPTPVSTAPAIAAFSTPTTVPCSAGEVVQVSLSWHVERATGVTLSIDGPGKYDDYAATATVEVPFSCGESQHTYTITSIGGSGPAASETRTIKRA